MTKIEKPIKRGKNKNIVNPIIFILKQDVPHKIILKRFCTDFHMSYMVLLKQYKYDRLRGILMINFKSLLALECAID